MSKNDHNNIRCRTQFFERTVHSGDEIDYDDRADDEQTVVTFRTGRGGGRPRKPKIPNELLSEESNNYENNTNRVSKSNTKNSKQLKNNTTWGSWALRTLSNNSHIIQNYLIRPAVMAGAFNDPSHLVNRGSLFYFQRMITSSSAIARGSIKRSNTAEGMYRRVLKFVRFRVFCQVRKLSRSKFVSTLYGIFKKIARSLEGCVNFQRLTFFNRFLSEFFVCLPATSKQLNTRLFYNPFNVTNNDSTSTSKTKLKMKRRPKNK